MNQDRSATITGLGVQCAAGSGLAEFTAALRDGVPGVTFEPPAEGLPPALGVAALPRHSPRDALDTQLAGIDPQLRDRTRPLMRRATRSKQYALLAAIEAWSQAALPAERDTTRTGIVVAGGNQAHELYQDMGRKFRKSPSYVRPSYAVELWDTDLLGTASELLGCHGEGLSTGGASAAGNVGLLTGLRMVRDGYADVCLVLAPLTELSPVERMALFNLGALGAKTRTEPAGERCRPFDAQHDGFIYGEGAAALVLESPEHAARRGARPLATLLGGASALHGSRLTTPSLDGEVRVMRRALDDAGRGTDRVDLISAHATSTPLGDVTEAEAIREVFGERTGEVWVNATKSLIGHCLGAAAAIQAVAAVQQLRHGFIHPNANLKDPVPQAEPLRLAPTTAVDARPRLVLSNAFGFGGINTSVLLGEAPELPGEPPESPTAHPSPRVG
ncbi:beta-ketoacyl synthase N-terminal-like domain-containing protein [Streptomyces sp. NPDC058045]|uniref:beta-ketoacyl synthase N-terminal-like domain-containing protein n=1 Tax=Streptomyces sp. NPDC058045 TaxID=3346311 RepID=UPI0036E5B19D